MLISKFAHILFVLSAWSLKDSVSLFEAFMKSHFKAFMTGLSKTWLPYKKPPKLLKVCARFKSAPFVLIERFMIWSSKYFPFFSRFMLQVIVFYTPVLSLWVCGVFFFSPFGQKAVWSFRKMNFYREIYFRV